MRKFEPIRFNVKNEDLRNAYNLKEGVEGFFDGKEIRVISYAVLDSEEEAKDVMKVWEDFHCEVFPVPENPEEPTKKLYAFACNDYFIEVDDIDTNSVRYIKDNSENYSESLIYSIITNYILSLR